MVDIQDELRWEQFFKSRNVFGLDSVGQRLMDIGDGARLDM